MMQSPKKCELSGLQISTRKNFPDEVHKSFSRPKMRISFSRHKSVYKLFSRQRSVQNNFCDKKKRVWIIFATKNVCIHRFRGRRSVHICTTKKVWVNSFCEKKICKISILCPSQVNMCCFCNIITILWWHNHTSLMHKL